MNKKPCANCINDGHQNDKNSNACYNCYISIMSYTKFEPKQQQVKVEPEVIVKTAEEIKQAKLEVLKEIKIEVAQQQQRMYENRIPYVKDNCWDIVEDIDSDIKLLEGIIRGLTFKIDELEK